MLLLASESVQRAESPLPHDGLSKLLSQSEHDLVYKNEHSQEFIVKALPICTLQETSPDDTPELRLNGSNRVAASAKAADQATTLASRGLRDGRSWLSIGLVQHVL